MDELHLFDIWNATKKRINQLLPTPIFPKESEVWMCSIGKNIGQEMNGHGKVFSRPVLILKRFNKNIVWIVPLSTKQKDLDFYYNFQDTKGNKVSVILAQMRLISVKRLERKMYTLPHENFTNIKQRLIRFLR